MKKLLALIFIPFILFGCKDEEYDEIVLSEVTHSIFYTPQYVAIEKGYFLEEGIKIKLVNAGGADKVTAALLSKEANIGFQGAESSVYVYNQGQSNYLINFAQLTKRDGSFIVGREKNDDFKLEDMKGKEILAGRKGGMPQMVLEYILNEEGIDAKKNDKTAEVNLRTDVEYTAQAGAFANGVGDYTTLFEPMALNLEKENKGYVVASLGELLGDVPYTVYNVTKSYFENNKELLKRFTKAILKGIKFVNENTDLEVAKAIKNQFKDLSIADIEKIVKRYREIDCWTDNLKFNEDNYNKLLDIMIFSKELDKKVEYNKIVSNEILN